MTHWNNRVWRVVHNAGTDAEEIVYAIKETYYNKSKEVCGCTEESAQAYGYSREELVENLQRMLKIASDEYADVLEYSNFKFAGWDAT